MNPANTDKAVRFAEMARHVDEGIRALERRALRDAIVAFERAYQVAKEANLGADALVGTLRNLALARREAGDHRGAVAAYRLALRAPGITDRQKASVLHGLGIVYVRLGAYRRARALLTRARSLWQQALKQTGPTWETDAIQTERFRVALDLSRTLRALGRYEDARCLLQQLLDELTGVDPSRVPYAYLEMARIALARDLLKEARYHLARALSFSRSNEPSLEAEARVVEAQLLLRSGQHPAALAACARALDLGVRHRLSEDLRDAHRLLDALLSRGWPHAPDGLSESSLPRSRGREAPEGAGGGIPPPAGPG